MADTICLLAAALFLWLAKKQPYMSNINSNYKSGANNKIKNKKDPRSAATTSHHS
jgi:hypothetical protein